MHEVKHAYVNLINFTASRKQHVTVLYFLGKSLIKIITSFSSLSMDDDFVQPQYF